MIDFPNGITWDAKYDPAMNIYTQEEADEYFEACVQHFLRLQMQDGFSPKRDLAEQIERTNLGYWAGYYDNETRARVEKLFNCAHPVFGAIAECGPPTPEEAFKMGMQWAGELKAKRQEQAK